MAGFNSNGGFSSGGGFGGFNQSTDGRGFNPDLGGRGSYNPGPQSGPSGGFPFAPQSSQGPSQSTFNSINSINRGQFKVFVPSIIVSILYGILWHFLGEILVRNLINRMWNPLAVAIYVMAFVLPLIIILVLMSHVAGNLSVTIGFWGMGKGIGLLVLCLAVTFMGSLMMEFLYELGGDLVAYKPTSYVFVIDDSGSMLGNDPHFSRASAVNEIMEDADIPYCVYRFGDDAELIRSMDDYEDGDSLDLRADLGTNILQALYTVSLDMEDPNFGGGARPKVLLLSDGESGSNGMMDVAQRYVDMGVSVSTVGFGSVSESLMEGIAQQTGGVFVYCDDLSTLKENMELAMTSSSTRTLLTPRYNTRNNVLYMILRILFLAGIGALIGLCKARGAFSDTDYMRIIIFTAGQSFAAALLCEFMINSFPGTARLLLNLLWALTVMTHLVMKDPFGSTVNSTLSINDANSGPGHTQQLGGNGNWNNGSGNGGWNNGSGNSGWNNGSGNGGWNGGSGNGGWNGGQGF